MTLHGIALGKSAISGSLFCAVFRTVTKHDITKSNANRACCHRSVEHDGWVNSRRQRMGKKLTGLLFLDCLLHLLAFAGFWGARMVLIQEKLSAMSPPVR